MGAKNTTGTIFGSDLILMIFDGTEYKPLAHATSHTIDFARGSRTVSSKSTGDYTFSEYGKASWSGSADALVSFDADIVNYDTLLDLQIARTKIKIVSIAMSNAPMDDTGALVPIDETLVETTGLAEGDAANADSAAFLLASAYRYGDAIITSVSLSAGADDNATFSISFEGSSELLKNDVSADA